MALPIAFIRNLLGEDEDPPLARLLRGGRGGEVRLKLYLCLCLRATSAPYNIKATIPARAWAIALGLNEPEGAGARRVGDALRWLKDNRYIRLNGERGHPAAIQLMDVDPLGSGEKYKGRGSTRYVTLPLSFWEQQWIVRLSGKALALLLVLLELQGGREDSAFLETGRKQEYGLSDDTWTRATAELKSIGLLKVNRISQGKDFDFRRMRNEYLIDKKRFDLAP